MKQTILNLSALCMFAALFDQLLEGRGIVRAVRIALALEVTRMLFSMLKDRVSMLI